MNHLPQHQLACRGKLISYAVSLFYENWCWCESPMNLNRYVNLSRYQQSLWWSSVLYFANSLVTAPNLFLLWNLLRNFCIVSFHYRIRQLFRSSSNQTNCLVQNAGFHAELSTCNTSSRFYVHSFFLFFPQPHSPRHDSFINKFWKNWTSTIIMQRKLIAFFNLEFSLQTLSQFTHYTIGFFSFIKISVVSSFRCHLEAIDCLLCSHSHWRSNRFHWWQFIRLMVIVDSSI